jgi:hypothetical protein
MQDEFEALDKDQKPGHGDPAILVCGCPPSVRPGLQEFATQAGFGDIPLRFAGTDDLEKTVAEVFGQPAGDPIGESRMPPAIIFSGLIAPRISQFIDVYKAANFPPVLWGGRVPPTDAWTLRQLLKTYQAEYLAMSGMKKQ